MTLTALKLKVLMVDHLYCKEIASTRTDPTARDIWEEGAESCLRMIREQDFTTLPKGRAALMSKLEELESSLSQSAD